MSTRLSSAIFSAATLSVLTISPKTEAALTVSLHPDGAGGTNVWVYGSGTTTAAGSQLRTNTLGEQWVNMTGNPFDDTLNADSEDYFFTTPIEIAAGVRMLGIQVDNDSSGDNEDDFRVYIDNEMSTNTPYSADGVTTLQNTLDFNKLSVGNYFDDGDGGTQFLNGFTLTISDQVLPVPEPSTAVLLFSCTGFLAIRRRRI